MEFGIWKWILFNALVLVMLALDLGVFHRKAHEVKMREALIWSAVWIAVALGFNGLVYGWLGEVKSLEFLTGYLVEKSLSMDNVFVIALIFSYFQTPPEYQHRVLFWGILGALVMRGIMIGIGAALIATFTWIVYVFGAFLILTGIRMALEKKQAIDPNQNPLVRMFRRFMPVTAELHGQKFFVRINARLWATPLFIALLLVEFTDFIFAVDSIPAIFAVTRDPFIVYTSNVFAILGLRALYFALAGIMNLFHYLKLGLSLILIFVGIKMLLTHTAFKIPIGVSLGVIGGILGFSIAASLMRPKKAEH